MTEQQLVKANKLKEEIGDLKFFLRRVEEERRLFFKTRIEKRDYIICANALKPFEFVLTGLLRDEVTELLRNYVVRLEKELEDL
ncbi:hypothetical protein [Clostridium novyi]|uniref:hypothetical protein n=1 Tax=Clostridium novyi TaxID=1542 RepID=UPI0004D98E0F|nr:hypothetical protein [Clostridium novyi]KEI12607.1 hypothetical protein Z958_05930 [Clostridium novyi B str. NCTC 9691]